MFADFGITNTDNLDTDTQYTFTYDAAYKALGFVPWQSSETTVQKDLQDRMMEGTILGVNRGFASGRYAITFQPTTNHNLQYWLDSFAAIFNDAGYKSTFVTVEAGKTSSKPGGVQQVASDTAHAVANVAGDTVGALFTRLWPYLLGIAVVGAGYVYVYGKAGRAFKSNPRRMKAKRRRHRSLVHRSKK